jgi:hypothetical protein
MTRQHGSGFFILVSVLILAAAGCSKPKTNEQAKASPPSATPINTEPVADPYACTLLTAEEAQAVQGEPFKSTKGTRRSNAGLSVSQCYFELPTAVNSIVLTVTQKAEGANGRDPRENWQEIFHGEHKSEEEREEKGSKEPQKIDGLGDEALWIGTRVGGALHVLKGNCYIRISVGGAGDQAQKIEKSKTLAESVLKRL